MPIFHVTAPDGHVLEITGPEGSTQEQAIEQAKKQYQPQDSSQPQVQSGTDKMIGNIPGSLYKAVTHPIFPGMPVGQGDATHPATFEDFKAKTLPKIVETVKHPLNAIGNAFIEDPIGTGLTAAAMGRGAFPNTAGTVEGAISGGARAASEQVRPLLSKFSPFMHPAKMLPDLYDAAGNVIRGAKEGVQDFRATQRVGTSATPVRVASQPEVSTESIGPLSKPELPSGRTPGPTVFKPAERVSRSIPDVSKITDMPVGPTVKPVLPSGRRVPSASPETLPSKPVTRAGTQVPPAEAGPEITSHLAESRPPKIILDENGHPLTTEDPVNGVTEKDFDIHKKIAQEGVEKRAADSKAKYEDVYQNLIKDNYSPEELRKLATDVEAKTSLDMQIKNLRHPEGHAKAGHRKYGSGLNPQMIETLAQRLESETPQ